MGDFVIVVMGRMGLLEFCKKINNNFKLVLFHALYVFVWDY